MAMRRFLTLIFISALTAFAAHAQSVRWEAADSGDPSDLQLIFEDCSPDGDPQLPRIPGLTLSLTGSSSQTTMNNFTISRSTILLYRARSQSAVTIRIPAFSVKTNKGTLQVPAFTGGTPKTAAEANVLSRLELGSPTVWAGEVFPLTYVLDVSRRSFNQLGTHIEWDATPLVIEEWSKFEPSEVTSGGEARLHIRSQTRGYAKTPGSVVLNPASQLVNLQSGSIGFGLFQTPRVEQLSVTSNTPALLVKPLPNPSPVGFSGAVGQFKLSSKVVPTAAAVGEPVTWTIELTGTGNWPDVAGLPQRDVSKDFNVVQPQAKRTPTEGKLFDSTLSEDVVLVPTKAGEYTLGPVDFVFFDPASRSYKTVSAPRTTVTISTPASVSSPSQTVTNAPAAAPSTSPPQAKAPPPDLKAPPLPHGIPRDPLPGSSIAIKPLPLRAFLSVVAAPFALLLLFWGYLAVDRARRNDPLVPQRSAKERLAATIARLRNANAVEKPALLLSWQHDAAVLWQLPHAAPAATILPDAAWSQLWSEADRALYSSSAELPSDWPQRAEAALSAKRVAGFQPLTALFPRNLFPFVAALALTAFLTPMVRGEDSTAARDAAKKAYDSGEFAAAGKGWQDLATAQPADAIARHNLSLALAQQDRWGEAAAHAAASFIQQPSNPRMGWQLALAAEKSGSIPAPLVGFFPPGPRQSLAQLASPGAWQVIGIAAAAVIALACAAALLNAYRPPSRIRKWSAVAGIVAGVAVGLCAASSLHAYGVLVDQRAAIVWRAATLRSIPTEADTTQKTTAVAPGSVGIADKSLLGWVRLNFANDQSGWIRKEELIGLWRAAPQGAE